MSTECTVISLKVDACSCCFFYSPLFMLSVKCTTKQFLINLKTIFHNLS